MIDDVQSFVAASEVLKERGAYKIYVLATHGLLSSDAPRLIEDSPIDEVILNIPFSFRLFSSVFSGGRNQYHPSRVAEDAVPQNQDCGHLDIAVRGDQTNPQQGVDVVSV